MEFELSMISQKSGFSKKQISEWAKIGIIPSAVRIENKGRGTGKIVYYPEETLNRLLVLKEFPVKSITKKSSIGIAGLGFILFLFGYNDHGIRVNVKKFVKQSVKNLLKSYKIYERKPKKDLLKEDLEAPLPEGYLYPICARIFGGFSISEMKGILPEDTSEPEYDEIFDFGLNALSNLLKNDKKEVENLAALFPDEFRNQLIKMRPIKEIPKEVDKITDKEFELLQATYMLLLGIKSMIGIPKDKIISSFTKANELSTNAVIGYYFFKMLKNSMKEKRELENEILQVSKKIKATSDETANLRKKAGRVKKIKLRSGK